ncbi:Uncharacterised protein [BD1-7 clade bacterium]|uniref:Uncharacterized protein n=1 Tax=BD1-7 clade bacterium TaxID=2029982 RepID=A0A5S9QWX5_9GAMM|nr:Uncharacterised protein [BD1-7 clade bacterium]
MKQTATILTSLLTTGFILSGCNQDVGPTPPAPIDSIDPPSSDESRFSPDSYIVSGVNNDVPYGLWVLMGDEQMAVTLDGDTDSGTVTRRMFFTLKPGANSSESEIRLCHVAQSWMPANTSNIETSGFEVLVEDGPTTLNYQFSFVTDNDEPTSEPTNRMSVTLNFSTAEDDSSTTISGSYTALQLSQNIQANLGTLTADATAIDYSAIGSGGITMQTLFDDETLTIECVNDIEADFIAAVSSDVPGLTDDVKNILATMTAFNRIVLSTESSHQFDLGVIETTSNSRGYMTLIQNDLIDPGFLVSLGGAENNTYDITENTTRRLLGNVSTENHLGETADVSFDVDITD